MNSPKMKYVDIPFPAYWSDHACRAVLYVADMAHTAMVRTRSWCADSPLERVRLRAKVERLEFELENQREINRIITARLKRVDPHKRPRYKPNERLSILERRRINAWSKAQTARTYLVTDDTITYWESAVDAGEGSSLFSLTPSGPVNKYPDYVAHIVQRLKVTCPHLGKKKIVQFLARAALNLSETTVGRMLRKPVSPPPGHEPTTPDPDGDKPKPEQRIVAKKPDSIWHVDFTQVPIEGGMWRDAIPASKSQVFPHTWWVAVAEDHFSRQAVGFALFPKQPTAEETTAFLDRIIRERGKAPKYMISDRGKQFDCDHYKEWAKDPDKKKERKRRKIRLRFGAVGKHGSVAVVERLIRTMKDEYTRRILVPYNLDEFRKKLERYFNWYNCFRPHETLDGRTPMEAYNQVSVPNNQKLKLDTRGKEKEGISVRQEIAFLDGDRLLPVVSLKTAS